MGLFYMWICAHSPVDVPKILELWKRTSKQLSYNGGQHTCINVRKPCFRIHLSIFDDVDDEEEMIGKHKGASIDGEPSNIERNRALGES